MFSRIMYRKISRTQFFVSQRFLRIPFLLVNESYECKTIASILSVFLFKVHSLKTVASGPITSWQIDRETVETVSDFIWGRSPKSLQMVIAAMKLKEAYPLEGKL